MYAESIATWLRRKSRIEAAFDGLVCMVLLTCTLAILGLTWGFGYVISLLLQQTFGSFAQEFLRTDLPHVSLIDWAFASGFLLILFAAHVRREREAAGDYPQHHQITGARDSFFPWAIRMSVDTASDAAGRMTSDFVLIGPRLSFFTYTIFHRAVRLSQMDYRRCAQILEALVRRGRRMSFVELEQLVPDANRFHVFDQLRDIDGVVFLLSEPAGISLVQDLRTELRNLPMPTVTNAPSPPRPQPSAKAEFRPPEAPPAVEVPKELEECYYILGISKSATEAQVRDAYRKKIKECHPDRFNRFGKDWQKLAEDRSKQVNLAYERIMERF